MFEWFVFWGGMVRYNPESHHRRSIRLKRYDYSRAGVYFVTICVHARECLFGEIVAGVMQENNFGRIVTAEWLRSAIIRAEIELGEFVTMPNHFHGIIHIVDDRRGDRPVALTDRPVALTPATPKTAIVRGPQAKFRGNGGQDIFPSNLDLCRLLTLLQEGTARFRYRVHAFCFKTNYIHLSKSL